MRYLMALAAGLAALNSFLIGWPGDLVPQGVLLAVGAANAFVAAAAAYLARP